MTLPLLKTWCILLLFYIVSAQKQTEFILEFNSVEETTLFLNHHRHDIKKVRHTFDSDIFTGVSVEFQDEKVAKQIIKQDTVVQHWQVHHRIHQQAPIRFKDENEETEEQGSDVEDESNDVVTTFVPQHNDTLSILTRANQVYQGLQSHGAGIKVGIIDSGVDYTLPALGGCFGPNCKVAFGYDLVGNHFNGTMESIQESDDPMDDCTANSTSATGHGTFIAGIIAAQDNEYHWTGVAPDVTLGMWKVYGCKTSFAPNDILIKAMEMAYKAGMDIINISLGVSGGWAEDVLSVVADRLVAQGVHVITASGNIGTSGVFLTASPASGKNVIAAGSINNDHVPGYILKLTQENNNNSDIEIVYRTFVNSPLVLNGTIPLVPTSTRFDAENDACHNGKIAGLNGNIALIHVGGCDPLQKIMHAQQSGAIAVILYTDIQHATTSYISLPNAVLPVAFINKDDANIAYQASKAQFTNIMRAMEAPEIELDAVSGFSTLGPTNELELKPELMAVGGNVFSTLPRYLNSYGFRSGTSFSTPYIAGCVALFLANTDVRTNPIMVKSYLMNSAHQVKGPISAVHYGDSPIRQGAGVIRVAQAIENYHGFRVAPAKLSLNDTAHFNNNQPLEVYNHNTEKETTFIFTHHPSLTATGYSLTQKDNFTPLEPIGLYSHNNSVAHVAFSQTTLVVPAGLSGQINVTIQPPMATFTEQSHALYGGYVMITNNDTKLQASVPYFGMIGNMHDLPILDRSSRPLPSVPYTFPSIGLANGRDTVHEVGHFQIKHGSGGPYILARLLTGTRILQFQILNKDDGIVGDIPIDATRLFMMRNTLTVTEYSKSYYSWQWNGDYVPENTTLSGTNGDSTPKFISSGEYRIKIRAQRVFKDTWDEWISPRLAISAESVVLPK